MPPPPPPPPPPSGSDPESFEPPPPESGAQGQEPARGWATTGVGESVQLAGAGHRLLARIVDIIVLGIPAAILATVIFDPPSDDTAEVSVGVSLTITAIWLIYEISMIALKGQTLGKMATRIKVVRAENGGLPEWNHSFMRWAPLGACSIISAWVPIIGLLSLLIYLSFVWDRKRQGWHDMVGKTLVIKT